MKVDLLILIVFLSISIFSCRRKAVHKEHPEMIGGWHHTEFPNKNHYYIAIREHSWGTVTLYDSLYHEQTYNGENPRRWRYNEKTKTLTNGLIGSPKFVVDQFPQTATTQIISNFDTINVGDTYCIINGGYYRKY